MTSIKNYLKLDKKIEKILEKKEQGNYKGAIMEAEDLLQKYPDIDYLFGLVASMYFENEQFEKAAEQYKKAVEIFPTSQMASLGLFHSLWQLEQNDDAFEEMKRYMSISNSGYPCFNNLNQRKK